MGTLHRYLVEEVEEDYVDGLISRREALRRFGLLGVGVAAATSILAACAQAIEFDGPDGRLRFKKRV